MTRTGAGRAFVCLGVAVALAAPASQAIWGWGLSAAEFSASGDSTLRVAGYAFSIWSVIYLCLVAYAIRRIAGGPGSPTEAKLDGPLALASLGCGLWIIAAGLDLRWLTVAIIFAALTAALAGVSLIARAGGIRTWRDRAKLLWPASLLAGWLTVASVVNLVTMMTAQGLIADASAPAAAMAAIVAAGVISAAILITTRFPSYILPVAWGLIGAFVAEREDKPMVAMLALGCAVLLLAAAAVVWLKGRQTGDPPASRA